MSSALTTVGHGIVVAAITCGIPGCAREWRTYSDPVCGFRIEVPADLRVVQEVAETGGGVGPIRLYYADPDEKHHVNGSITRFVMILCLRRDLAREDPLNVLERKVMNSMDARVISRAPTSIGNLSGLDLRVTSGHASYRVRLLNGPSHSYALLVDDSRLAGILGDKVLDSFRLH
jgi:hypothetical protein